MYTPANAPQSIGAILDSGFKLFTSSIKQVLPITYLGAVLGGLWSWGFQSLMFDQTLTAGQLNIDWPFLTGAYVLMIVISSIFMAAALLRIRAASMAEPMSFGGALQGGVRRAPAVIGVSILYMLAFMIGLVLLVVPGVYLSVMLAFAFYAAAGDGMGPIDSARYSYGLVKGYWWRTAGLLTVIFIIAMVIYFAVGLAAGLIAVSQQAAGTLEPSILAEVVITPLFTSVAAAMMYCLAYAAYHDLKLRREGTDLAERIGNLTEA